MIDFQTGHPARMEQLDEVKKERVYLFAFPLRVTSLGSTWIRAVAFELMD
jgi:hypothetical protein